jgi:thiol-disulfide isomerase/thioredoxin
VKQNTDRLIQRIAGLSTIALVLLTAFIILEANGAFRGHEKAADAYKIGEKVDLPPAQIVSAASTVIVFARSTCGACQASRPTLAKVVDLAKNRPHVAAELLAVAGLAESEFLLADTLGIPRENVRTFDRIESMKLKFVPSVLVVNDAGSILYAYQGAPPPEELPKIAAILDRRGGGPLH